MYKVARTTRTTTTYKLIGPLCSKATRGQKSTVYSQILSAPCIFLGPIFLRLINESALYTRATCIVPISFLSQLWLAKFLRRLSTYDLLKYENANKEAQNVFLTCKYRYILLVFNDYIHYFCYSYHIYDFSSSLSTRNNSSKASSLLIHFLLKNVSKMMKSRCDF